MPSRNIVKVFAEKEYYHIYNRGVAKQRIFLSDEDKEYFLGLFDRYLNIDNSEIDSRNLEYQKYNDQLELLCFCLMENHFHFVFWIEKDNKSITNLMRCICTSYTMYFNRKYNRVGPLFQSNYKASRITSDPYLLHISRYIHLNPKNIYKNYKYSSYSSYISSNKFNWLKPNRMLNLFELNDYEKFVGEYYLYIKDYFDPDTELVDNYLPQVGPAETAENYLPS